MERTTLLHAVSVNGHFRGHVTAPFKSGADPNSHDQGGQLVS